MMSKNLIKILYSVLLLGFCFSIESCKNSKAPVNENAEEIFSLSTTPCFGQCPVFKMHLYGDKTLFFEGNQHTKLEGDHKKVLSDKQFEKLLGIIESAEWSELNDNYETKMTDFPTQNFNYNRNGINKSVSKYGTEPQELSEMTKIILTFIENEVFKE